jgi:hypothetical protein
MGERTGRTLGIEGGHGPPISDEGKDRVHSSTGEGKKPNQEGRKVKWAPQGFRGNRGHIWDREDKGHFMTNLQERKGPRDQNSMRMVDKERAFYTVQSKRGMREHMPLPHDNGMRGTYAKGHRIEYEGLSKAQSVMKGNVHQ